MKTICTAIVFSRRIAAVGGLLLLVYVVWLHWQMSYAFRSREAQRTILAEAGINVTGSVSPFWKFGALEVWPSSDLDSSITRLRAIGTDFGTPQGKQAIECISRMGRLQKLSLLNCNQSDQLLSIATKNPIDYLVVDGEFSDQDLESLLGMRDLRAVRLYNTHATEQGVREFHSKRPSVRIEVFGSQGLSMEPLQLGPLANEVICEPSIDNLQLWYPPRSECLVR
ncbi:MAG: hypothetical protein ABL921_28640 [Pirellula sp.]